MKGNFEECEASQSAENCTSSRKSPKQPFCKVQ